MINNSQHTQAIGSHRSDEEGSHKYMTSGPTGRMEMEKGPTSTSSGPTGWMEIEKYLTGTRDM
jgi:hypothetical protein